MGLVKKVLALGTTFAMGVAVGSKSEPEGRYLVSIESQQPYLVDRLNDTRIPIYEENNQIQCGDVSYRMQGVLNKGYEHIRSLFE